MSNVKFQHLFTPLQVGPMRVPNRICETTNTINSSMVPGMIDENFIAHHLAKVKGGTGWIVSETWLLNVPFPPETPDEVGLGIGCAPHFAAYQFPISRFIPFPKPRRCETASTNSNRSVPVRATLLSASCAVTTGRCPVAQARASAKSAVAFFGIRPEVLISTMRATARWGSALRQLSMLAAFSTVSFCAVA